jgi:hypothetical protein
MEKKLEIGEEYLKNTLKAASSKMVGETLAILEVVKNIEDMKQLVKNNIHQNFRDLQAQIQAFNDGIKFISPKTVKE